MLASGADGSAVVPCRAVNAARAHVGSGTVKLPRFAAANVVFGLRASCRLGRAVTLLGRILLRDRRMLPRLPAAAVEREQGERRLDHVAERHDDRERNDREDADALQRRVLANGPSVVEPEQDDQLHVQYQYA